MKILSAEITNFGSYRHLEFDFSNLGLCLVSGPTGAGKSTLQDIVPWILFGITAKGGKVDEVKNWNAEGPTTGTVHLDTSGDRLTICRVRGRSADNDLFWTEGFSTEKQRGKDLADTQRLLEARLQVSAETYLSAAYFHEFSSAGTFFTAKSKERRLLFDGLADLTLPGTLSDRSGVEKKLCKDALSRSRSELSYNQGRLESLESTRLSTGSAAEKWSKTQAQKIVALKSAAETFEEDRRQAIRQLTEEVQLLELKAPDYDAEVEISKLRASAKCNSCGAVSKKNSAEIEAIIKEQMLWKHHRSRMAQISKEIDKLLDSNNTYAAQSEEERLKANPFEAQLLNFDTQKASLSVNIKELETQVKALEHRISLLETLSDLSSTLRAALLQKAVQSIQDNTNKLLDKYFDCELKVEFAIQDSDKLEVSIQKSGNSCVYTQLSRGQRQMLKLCFAVSVMEASANLVGQHFNAIFYDEALSGMDSQLKIKAYSLFQDIAKSHETVLVIDHSPEFQQMFDVKYQVVLEGDESRVERE